ncbi:MAG: oligosaccharide flippase family protein [Patescibacteria group bacterium]|nr:oligosaccharide flippase family protein [Patescibacteria group bacterium]MCL5095192.1 oligosaccharide flippase family protein [Patescibacteria group bacterium]
MDEIGLEEVKKRAVGGVLALTSRTFLLQIISFLTTFLLTIFLAPSVFGVFFVVSAVISFLGYFSDIGLAAALIQKREAVTEDDLKTTFTIQQVLVGAIVIIALLLSRQLSSFYNLDTAGLWLFRALVVSFFLSSLKTIPSILLERKLAFNKLVIPQILETNAFSLIVVVLAVKGFGLTSFTWAVLARGVIGLAAIYVLSPWKIGIGFSKTVAKRLLSFGLPFQANSILALIKDDLFTIFLGKVLPFNQIGYIGWAKKWAEFPLRLVMDNVIKVTFPAYARLQEKPEYLGKALDKSIFFLSFLILPLSVAFVFAIKPLVFFIPKYLKWEPALFSFYLFVIASIFAGLSTPLTNVLNAIGKIKITLYLMIVWTVLTWLLGPFLVFKLGFNGVAVSSAMIGLTVVIPVLMVKRFVRFHLVANIMPSLVASMILAVFFYLTLALTTKMTWLIFVLLMGSIIYLVSVYILTKGRIFEEAKTLWQNFRS